MGSNYSRKIKLSQKAKWVSASLAVTEYNQDKPDDRL